MNLPGNIFALFATFGAVFVFGFWLFRQLLIADKQGGGSGSNKRWVAAVSSGVIVLSIWVAVGSSGLILPLISTAGVVLFSYRLPVWMDARRRKRRAEAFRQGLVDLTVGMANGLRGGGALGQTLGRVTNDLRGVTAEEMNQLLKEHHVGVEMAECFERLRQRMPSEDMTLLATAIRLTLSTGGSLAEVLDKMTAMMRERRDFDERLKTMTAQGRFEALAMGLAPLAAFGVLFLIDRSMVEPLYTTTIGRAAIGVVLFLECLGFYFINKIVSIEV
jgi:tight adherence protein B